MENENGTLITFMLSPLFTNNIVYPLISTFNIQFKKREIYSHKNPWPLIPCLEDTVKFSQCPSWRHKKREKAQIHTFLFLVVDIN
jgi:hypothetical protein